MNEFESTDRNANAVGVLLKTARTKSRLTQVQVAGEVRCAQGYLSRLERGMIGHPSAEILARLALIYEIPAQSLFSAIGQFELARTIGGAEQSSRRGECDHGRRYPDARSLKGGRDGR